MKIIKPTIITEDVLVNTNVPESPPAEYSSSTSYSEGDTCIVSSTHKEYESLQDSNSGHYPPDSSGGDSPFWLELGATNPWRAFDTHVGTSSTTNPSSISYTLTPGICTGVALLDIVGASAEIKLTDPVDGLVYEENISLVDNSGVVDWYDYFFAPFSTWSSVIKMDLPPYRQATLEVTLTGSGNVEVGELIVGEVVPLGGTQYAPSMSIIDYSKKEVDVFGNFNIIE